MAIKILIGGSPCTFWSIAQHPTRRETTASGQGWELFYNYLLAKEKFKPDYFLYENNCSASREIKESIEKALNVKRMEINSALVSAQVRKRFYCFNWRVEQPEDRGIILQDILENGLDLSNRDKAYALTASYNPVPWNTIERKQKTMIAVPVASRGRYDENGKSRQCIESKKDGKTNSLTTVQKDNLVAVRIGDIGKGGQAQRVYSVRGKSVCLKANGGGQGAKTGLYKVDLPDGDYIIRKLTPIEYERLQTLPDNYTAGVSNTQRYKCLGNGWTAEVITHILKGALDKYPRSTPLQVLSMYDGIATGRYCLDKLGFTNVTYKAYEIDKYAIKIALKNYPDIIQCGDAFQIRNINI